MVMKKSLVRFTILMVLGLSSLAGFAQPNGLEKEKKKYDPVDKLTEIFSLVRTYYTDTVNEEKLVEDAISKVLEDLDPHSSYVPAKDVKRTEEVLVGNFEGVG